MKCRLACLVAFGMLVMASTPAFADMTGRESILDGDTIEVHGQRIRLFSVDGSEGSPRTSRAAGASSACEREPQCRVTRNFTM